MGRRFEVVHKRLFIDLRAEAFIPQGEDDQKLLGDQGKQRAREIARNGNARMYKNERYNCIVHDALLLPNEGTLARYDCQPNSLERQRDK